MRKRRMDEVDVSILCACVYVLGRVDVFGGEGEMQEMVRNS